MIPLRLLFRDEKGNDHWVAVFIPAFLANFELEDAIHDCFGRFPTTTTKRSTSGKSERKVGGDSIDDLLPSADFMALLENTAQTLLGQIANLPPLSKRSIKSCQKPISNQELVRIYKQIDNLESFLR